MYSINNDKKALKVVPHILPCKINFNGPVDASERYWNINNDENGQKITYFRGRKLVGKDVNLPKGYSGAIIQKTNELLPQQAKSQPQMDEDDLSADEGQDVPQEVVIMQEAASFDKLTIWGHEAVPSESEDPYIKGVQEWIQCASSMHSYDTSK